jgi:ribosomal protein RSM22 (predicted rRNA methylase)
MELPPSLRQAVDEMLAGSPLTMLRAASERLSRRYRAETRDGQAHLSDRSAALAYLAARLPATYAALRASFAAAADLRPDFVPRAMLDAGAGPGTAAFAAQAQWSSLSAFDLVESSEAIRTVGETLACRAGLSAARWLAQDLAALQSAPRAYDLVTLAYVLDELPPAQIASLVGRLWAATADMLVVVEPGTPAGWSRILALRAQLIEEGAQIVAPCPHRAPCPLAPPDWCHFAQRVARGRLHRQVKAAEVPWEDEKFIYLAATRRPGLAAAARVIAPPQKGGGTVTLKLCRSDGQAAARLWSRREGDAYRAARRLDWGDAIVPDESGA